MKIRRSAKSGERVETYGQLKVNDVFKPVVKGNEEGLHLKVRNKVTGNKLAINLKSAEMVNLPIDTVVKKVDDAYIHYED